MKRALLVMTALATVGCVGTNIFAPDGTANDEAGFIYFASNREGNNFELYRMPASGGDMPVRLTVDADHNDYSPMPSRDGKLLAWVREVAKPGEGVTSTEIWVMNADGSNSHALVQNGATNASPSWVAGDSALVYASDVGGDWEIYRVSLAGGSPRNLTNNPYADQSPRVSPDGQRIVFQSNRTLDFEIYTMAVDGTDVRDVSHNPADDRFPTWSADGRQILWTRYADSFNIWRMNADGSAQSVVLSGSFSDTSPAVAPDGSAVVFASDRVAPSSLFVYQLAGGGLRQLTNLAGWNSATDLDPIWVR